MVREIETDVATAPRRSNGSGDIANQVVPK
jgi:hypothetical protein